MNLAAVLTAQVPLADVGIGFVVTTAGTGKAVRPSGVDDVLEARLFVREAFDELREGLWEARTGH